MCFAGHLGSPYPNKGSSTDSAQTNLPLFIGVPAVIVLIVVIVAIVILQRRRRCNATARGLKVQRIAVPTHDKDFYTNYHNSNILQTSREKIPKMSTQSLDFYSDNISSVSRSQQHSHQHVYGYWVSDSALRHGRARLAVGPGQSQTDLRTVRHGTSVQLETLPQFSEIFNLSTVQNVSFSIVGKVTLVLLEMWPWYRGKFDMYSLKCNMSCGKCDL